MIIADVIEQHWEEAGLLWAQRAAAGGKASFSLRDLSDLDERVEAHLDGLRVAGEEGWKLCLRSAVWEEPGEAFAAGALALAGPEDSRIQEISGPLKANPALIPGFVSALGWLDASAVQSRIQNLLASDSPIERLAGLGGAAVHRLRIEGPLAKALNDPEELIAARACRAVGELGLADLAGRLPPHLSAKAEACAFWAAWSLAVHSGHSAALRRLGEFLGTESPWQVRAAEVLFRRMEAAAAADLQRRIAAQPGQTRLAIRAAGIIGDPGMVPWLLEQMNNPKAMRLAADAFQTITGADFVMAQLRKNSPPRPPVAEDTGEDQPLDPDEDLVWPEPAAVRNWWARHSDRFPRGTRCLLGKPLSPEWLREVLISGQQPQRAAAALELTLRQPGTPLFNIKAPGFRQLQLLGNPEPAIR